MRRYLGSAAPTLGHEIFWSSHVCHGKAYKRHSIRVFVPRATDGNFQIVLLLASPFNLSCPSLRDERQRGCQ
jgi:hypothetical protein